MQSNFVRSRMEGTTCVDEGEENSEYLYRTNLATFPRGNPTYNLRVRTFSVSERQHDTLAAFQLDLGLHQISSIGEEARRSGQRREKGCSRGATDFLGRLGVSRPRSEEYIRQEVARHEKRFQVWIDNRIKIGREID